MGEVITILILFPVIALAVIYIFVRIALRPESNMLKKILQHLDGSEDNSEDNQKSKPHAEINTSQEAETKDFSVVKPQGSREVKNTNNQETKIKNIKDINNMEKDKKPDVKINEPIQTPKKVKGLGEKIEKLKTSEVSALKLLIIGFICLISFIPLSVLNDIIQERSRYAKSALQEVSKSWGGSQTLSGPIVNVPYKQKRIVKETVEDKDSEGKTIEKTITKEYWDQKNRVFLPDELKVNMNQTIEVRKRGIFEIPLYEAQFDIKGSLPLIDFSDKSEDIIDIQWNNAEISFLVEDTVGIKHVDDLTINEQKNIALSGFGSLAPPSGNGGFHFQNLDTQCQSTECTFSITGKLNGVNRFSYIPIARDNVLTISSQWPHPKFMGDGLPESHNITNEGFTAHWQTGNLVRSYPQINNDIDNVKFLNEYIVGFETITTVDHYSMAIRSAKYGILIVGLTLFALFIFEYGLNVRIHTVQYLVVSGALFLFYLTLLSLSEHTALIRSWAIASITIATMISVYISAIIRSLKYGFVLFSYLIGVYTVMYALLKLEDYALMIGTLILILVMIVIMFVTRKLHKSDADFLNIQNMINPK